MWPHVGTLNSQYSVFSTLHSLERWLQLFFRVLLLENSPPACQQQILGVARATTRKHWCLLLLVPWENFNRQTCKNHLRTKQGHRLKKDLSIADKLQWYHVLAHWTQHIQPSPRFTQSRARSAWAGLGRILRVAWATEKHWYHWYLC